MFAYYCEHNERFVILYLHKYLAPSMYLTMLQPVVIMYTSNDHKVQCILVISCHCQARLTLGRKMAK